MRTNENNNNNNNIQGRNIDSVFGEKSNVERSLTGYVVCRSTLKVPRRALCTFYTQLNERDSLNRCTDKGISNMDNNRYGPRTRSFVQIDNR